MSFVLNRFKRVRARAAASIAGLVLMAGCASTTLDAQWVDAQLPPNLLRGAKVMVMCEAQDLAIRRLCQDQVAAGLASRGATPVAVPENISVPIAPAVIDPQVLRAARDAGARAVFGVTVGVSAQTVSPGMSISIGGFGIGGHSAGGVGVSAPIGGGQVNSGYSANGRVTDAASGRLLWTAGATTPPSSNVTAQLSELAATVLAAADKAGMF